jgi:hypothetical protein
MTKDQLKKVILGQLATYLAREVIIDGITADTADFARAEQAQSELIAEFERRSGGTEYAPHWNLK